ncbi:MAG: PepSY-associated TM helix domain-containing protein [Cardiobacteriaceae bacterium]|nr:PepSY-associated TM helix domain-containing protein [Cardiobacteriaceae bacterium]
MSISTHTLKTYLPLHTWCGIICGLFLYICFIAGSLTLFSEALNRWATPPQAVQPVNADKFPDLIRQVLYAHPEAADGFAIYFQTDSLRPSPLSWGDSKGHQKPAQHWAFLNANGELDTYDFKVHALGDFMDELHQTAGIPGHLGDEDVGLLIMGVIAVMYTLALVSGTILLLPTLLANLFALRTDKSPRRAWLDSHNLLGLTSLPFHIVIAATTVVFAFHDSIYLGMDTLLPQEAKMQNLRPPAVEKSAVNLERLIMPQAFQEAIARKRPDFQMDSIIYSNLEKEAAASAYMQGRVQNGTRSAVVIANPYHGKWRYNNISDNPYVNIIDSFFRLHFGDYGGVFIRWIYFLLGLMGAALFYTGNLLWLEKRPARGKQKNRRDTHILAALTIGTGAGTIAGIAATLLAARWLYSLPYETENLSYASYYSVFLLFNLYAQYRGAGGATPVLIRCTAWMVLAIPCSSLLGSVGVLHLFAHHDMASLGVDATALILGLGLLTLAKRSGKRVARATADSVWYDKRRKDV